MPHLANWYFQIKRFISVEKLETDQFIFSSISSHAFVQISIHLNNRLQFRQNFWDENFWRISRKKQSQVWVGNEHESEWTKTQRVIEYKHIFIDGNNTFVLMLIMKNLLLRKYMKFPKNSAKNSKSSYLPKYFVEFCEQQEYDIIRLPGKTLTLFRCMFS